MQAQVFTGSASEIYLLLLVEFGGKGDRWANIARSKERGVRRRKQKAESRDQQAIS
jgi:hypothetical protein